MKNIILIAPQSAGKGTQAKMIEDKYNLPHISAGDLLRAEVNKKSSIGKEIEDILNKGDLVSHKYIFQLIENRILEDDCKNGYILDGFPRTKEQLAEYLDILTRNDLDIGIAILLDVEKEEVLKRIKGRRVCSNCGKNYNINYETQKPKKESICDECGGSLLKRDDDTDEAIEHRLNIYYTETEPLLNYYKDRNILYVIDGSKSPKEVFDDVDAVIEEANKW